MRNYSCILLFVLLQFVLLSSAFSNKDQIKQDSRMLINLLDYIGKDYSMAVTNGKVINEEEYKEMQEFSEKAKRYYKKIKAHHPFPDSLSFNRNFNSLDSLIDAKAPVQNVKKAAVRLNARIQKKGIVSSFPSKWPSLAKGKKLFVNKCARCHGKNGKGNGKMASGLSPQPTNFHDTAKMYNYSPFQAYNVIRSGMPGTAMRAFTDLSNKEVWALAFYLNTFPYQKKDNEPGKKERKLYNKIGLQKASELSDNQLKAKYSDNKNFNIGAFRCFEPEKQKQTPIDIAISHLERSYALYQKGKQEQASNHALKAYLEGIEPVEQQVRASDANLVSELESKMTQVRSAIQANKPAGLVEKKIRAAKQTLGKTKNLLEEQEYSFWFAGFLSGSILLREGLEAFLIIITILGVLRSAGAGNAMKWVHGGWIAAVIAGVSGWFFTDQLLAFGAQKRELMEGIGALFAVIILLYIGFWLHNKSQIGKWKAFIEDKIKKNLNTNNMIGLAILSFIVVFREAFESVLFLSSLKLEVAPANQNGIWAGMIISVILIAIMAWFVLKYSKKLPIRQLFKYSALIMGILSVILTGKGLHALQESGYLAVTSFPFNLRLSVLGIYPTMETIICQLAVVALVIILWQKGNGSLRKRSATHKKETEQQTEYQE